MSRWSDKTLDERFWDKVDKHGPRWSRYGCCWVWKGSLDRKGYGCINKKSYGEGRAHRWSWTALKGPIPDGLLIDHRCRNHACVNPAHLRVVTALVNSTENHAGAHQPFCRNGHPRVPSNLYYRASDGRFRCRACIREAVHRYDNKPAA